MNVDLLSCDSARAHLSARLDGEPRDERALSAHLASCEGCREEERALLALARDFARLRAAPEQPPIDLWPAIALRARPRPAPAFLARAAAAVAGFLSVAAAARVLERTSAPGERGPERHLLDGLAPASTHDLLASLPEYRLLRAFPAPEEAR